METSQKIQSIICGNPKSNAGYEPLYLLNNPTFRPMPNMGYPGMRDNDYFYAIKTFPEITVYTLIHCKDMKSFGASREGMLKIGIGIPKGMRLAEGKSPCQVLQALHDTFLRVNTRRDGEDIFFNMQMAPAEVMEETLNRFRLEEHPGAHRVMLGNSPVYLQENDITALMQDVAYPELEGYGELIVGETVSPHLPTVNLSVPRIKAYTLVVNGKARPWSVMDPENQRNIVNIDGFLVEFSIREIRNQGNKKWFSDAGCWVKVNDEREEVEVYREKPMPSSPPVATPPSAVSGKSNSIWLWILLGIFSVGICVALVITLWLR